MKILAIRVVLLWIVGYGFFVFHGLSFHLTPWSQAFINAIVKHTYGTKGQSETTVVLFREENLGVLGTHYPVPYAMHAEIIRALASYQPKAVFVDFAFIDPRPTDDVAELAEALCELQRARRDRPVDIFIAAPSNATVRPALERCTKLVNPQLENPTGVSGVLTYASHAGAPLRPTPAFALAAPELGIDPTNAPAMEIIWGKQVADVNRRWMTCTEPSLVEAIGLVLQRGPLALRLGCPYARTITVQQLLNFSGDSDIRDLLRERTVLYGAGFRLTGDRMESPVYAEMPGVYLHAMAYDNLATFGRHYKRADRDSVAARVTDAALLLVAAVLLVRFPRQPSRGATTLAEFRARILVGAVAAIAIALGVLLVAWSRGLDDGLLAVLMAYVLYRWRGARDVGLVILTGVTLVTALVYYYIVGLGPRNILAFLVFFEAVRHVETHLKEAAAQYFRLKGAAPAKRHTRLSFIDAFFSLYRESARPAVDHREKAHERAEPHPAH